MKRAERVFIAKNNRFGGQDGKGVNSLLRSGDAFKKMIVVRADIKMWRNENGIQGSNPGSSVRGPRQRRIAGAFGIPQSRCLCGLRTK